MSYRELRNFTEMLRALGYPRQLSIENFRNPNFKLVAEILAWLLQRYDPDYDLRLVIDTEQDRVIFIKTAALFMIQRARIKVNPKKLYQADGYAVQEMLKIATVLYSAIQQNQQTDDDIDDTINLKSITQNVNNKLNEMQFSRALATEITERGASLYDLLGKEVEYREQRTAALARPLELQDVEKSLRQSIKAVEEETKQTLRNLDNIASDEANLDAKIEKKKADLERQQKRLAQLQVVRPAYMDDYVKLEQELQVLYSEYVQKFRNLAFMEQVQREYDRAEQERTLEAEMSLRKMAEKMREEERTRQQARERLEVTEAMQQEQWSDKEQKAPVGPKAFGSMTGAGLSDEEEESLLSDEDGDEDADDDDDSDDIAGKLKIGGSAESAGTRHGAPRSGQRPTAKPKIMSDLSDEGDAMDVSNRRQNPSGAANSQDLNNKRQEEAGGGGNSDDDF